MWRARSARPTSRSSGIGIAAPKIAVSGLNPHAGEGGLFGREEIEIIKPAMDAVAAEGICGQRARSAPTPCSTCRASTPSWSCCTTRATSPTKLLAQNAAAALTIGTPILFASVAHGTGHDIAGKGIANPAAMIEAVLRMAKANGRLRLSRERRSA